MSMGNRHTERPPDPVLYGGRPSGGFVNRAVTVLAYASLIRACLALIIPENVRLLNTFSRNSMFHFMVSKFLPLNFVSVVYN